MPYSKSIVAHTAGQLDQVKSARNFARNLMWLLDGDFTGSVA